MRFLEFVPCGRGASPRPEQAPVPRPSAEEVAATNLPPGRSIATAAAPQEKRRRRASGSAASTQWRPTLGAISEDAVLRTEAAAVEKGGWAGSSAPAGKSRAAPRARSCNRDYKDDYRHFAAPSVFPAFAPTAFLF